MDPFILPRFYKSLNSRLPASVHPSIREKDVPPQDQLIVVLGLQHASLAKNVKGMSDEICVELRGVISEVMCSLTVEVDREARTKKIANML